MASKANVFVTIKFKNDIRPVIKHWTGKSKKSIMESAKKFYLNTEWIAFGNVWYTNSYGAH